jgi:hypothetical protein
MRIEESIVINRSPKDVFSFLAARRNDPVWMAAVVESRWLEPSGNPGVGRRGRMAMKTFGRRMEYLDEVTTYEPGRQIAHRTIEGPIDLNTACLCEPADGGCRTTVVAEADKILARPLDPLLARLMRRGFRADLAKLKQILEAGAHDRGPVAEPRRKPQTTAAA